MSYLKSSDAIQVPQNVKNIPAFFGQDMLNNQPGTLISSSHVGSREGPIDLCILGNYLYTANVNTGSLTVLDITVPQAPVEVSYAILSGANQAQAFYIYGYGKYIYIVSLGNSFGQLTALDVSNPGFPVQVGNINIGSGANDVKVVGHYAYVVTFNASFHVIDVSDPANMFVTGTFSAGGPTSFNGVDVQGKYAYVACQSAGGGYLFVLDVSDPTNPTPPAGPITLTGQPWQIVVAGRYAYVTLQSNDTLAIINISNPTALSVLSYLSLETGASPEGLAVTGRYAYIASNGTSTLDIVDISAPNNPVKINSIPSQAGIMSVAVSGPFVYSVSYSSNYLCVYYMNNIETTAILAHAAKLGNLHVLNHADIRGELQVGRSLSVVGGIVSDGDVLVHGTLSATNLNLGFNMISNGPTLNIGGGKASVGNRTNTFNGTTVSTIKLTIHSVSTDNPAVFTVDSTANLTQGQMLGIRNVSGTSANWLPDGGAAGLYGPVNVLNGTQFTLANVDGTSIVYSTDIGQAGVAIDLDLNCGFVLDVLDGFYQIVVPDLTLAGQILVLGPSTTLVQGNDYTNDGNGVYLGTADCNTNTQVWTVAQRFPAVTAPHEYLAGNNITLTPNKNRVVIDASAPLPTIQNVSDPSSLNVDLSQGTIVNVGMNGSLSLTAHGMVTGQRYIFVVNQAGGNDILVWDNTIFKGAMTISADATSTSIQEFLCIDGAHLLAMSPGVTGLFINPPPM